MEVKISTIRGEIIGDIFIVNPQSPLVILCHGFRSTKDSEPILKLAKYLNENNFSTFKFDFGNGIGKSYGEINSITITNQLEDLEDVIRYLKIDHNIPKEKLGMVGHSLGGFVCAQYLSNNDESNALILLAAVYDYAKRGKMFFGEDNYLKLLSGDIKVKDVYGMIRKDSAFDVGEQFYTDILHHTEDKYVNIKAPVLIIHGDDDKSINIEQALEYNEIITSEHTLINIIGADHNYTDEEPFEIICENVKEFLHNHLNQ